MPEQEYIKYLYEKEGCSIAEICRRVGVNRRTAAKYAKRDDWNIVAEHRCRPRPVMGPVAEVVEMWLSEDLLKRRKDRRNAARIYRQLREEYNFKGGERTVREYVALCKQKLAAAAEGQFVELDHPPGHGQVDFGKMRVFWDGELREISCLIFSFPYSNAGFCIPLPSENIECFLYAQIKVFEWVGGVPQTILYDNLPAAVITIGKGHDRKLVETFSRFALHYGFKPLFAAPAKGNEKGNVENKVGYSRCQWLLPYPHVFSYEGLTVELYERACRDMGRPHYAKGTPMSELFEADKKALLPLPNIPFEPVQTEMAKVNKYGQIHCRKEVYAVMNAKVGETVTAKFWWDRVEILDGDGKLLTTLRRHYTLKSQPVDWKGYFDLFVRKPRGARHASMYKLLPESVREYLADEDYSVYRKRLKFVYDLLAEGFDMEAIAGVLAEGRDRLGGNESLIKYKLYSLSGQERPLGGIQEAYTPESVRRYAPEVGSYDQLVPGAAGGKGGDPDGRAGYAEGTM